MPGPMIDLVRRPGKRVVHARPMDEQKTVCGRDAVLSRNLVSRDSVRNLHHVYCDLCKRTVDIDGNCVKCGCLWERTHECSEGFQ